ncbi:putative extracellular nuclease [Treponema primitia ZAS-2]|uniref:Putative extracellular nuclease n=1 Tax=Treponema primitia (strain ATCC BAA-887 / DSM 12427 / ZAS-2) TaxID=545694 RepID=F5YQ02_TREPZ|nr:hypothetical protein [Treponema primitia]AEF84790.1 putative extracellular nuclease [Treponema primitia ZAS-2]
MKNIRKTMQTVSLLSALAAALLLGSCANPFAPDKPNPEYKPSPDTTIPQGYGRLLVSLGLEEPAELAVAQQEAPEAALQAARTLIPGAFTRYEVTFTNKDDPPVVVTKTWTTPTGNVVDLIPGTWTIAVTAYAGTGTGAVASGTGQLTNVAVTAAAAAEISIPLSMKAGGSGTLSYTITFPGTLSSYTTRKLTIYNDNGEPISSLPAENPSTTNPITFTTSPATGTVSLNAGGYYLVAELENSQGRFARWTTAFHIYNGQTTPAAHSFGDGDFEESIPVSGTATLTVGMGITLSEVTVSAYGTAACDGLPVAGPVALASVTTGGTYTLFIPNRYAAVWLRLGAKDSADQPVSGAEASVTEVPINEDPVTQNLSAGIYAITPYAADGGKVTAPSAAFKGSTVAVTVSPAPGYFQSGKSQYTDSASITMSFDGGTFTMPALNVTLSANFALIATGGETDVAIVNNVGYDNLNAAFAAVPAGTGTAASPVVITVLKSTVTVTETITVDGGRYVQLVGAGYTTATITFNENTFLEVKAGAGLILGDGTLPIALDGDARWTNFDTGEHAGVSRGGALVRTAGAFTIKGSARVQNNYGGTTGEGGGVYVAEATGNLVVDGGAIENNWASKGGGVYLSGAGADLTVTQYGSISGNAAETGGGVYLSGAGAALTVTQYGSISGNAAETGGGVYAAGGNSTLQDGGSVEGNLAQDGGGVYLVAVETGIGPRLNIRVGGAVKANQASRNGGGVYVGKKANLTMTETSVIGNSPTETDAGNSATVGGGGLYLAVDATASLEGKARITGNTAPTGKGPDAALAATLNLNGGALVSDAYLINATGAIGVPGILTATVSAKITPHDYDRNQPVLTGVNVAANYTRFTLANPTADGNNYMIRRTGSLVNARYTRYRNATTVDYYTTLGDLLYDDGFPSESSSEDPPDEIRIASGTSSITLGAGEGFTIPAGVHVKLVPPSEGFTISRNAASSTPVFTVNTGTSLAIGGTTYALTLDGGSSTHTSPLVQVNGGTFTMGNIATLKNNKRSGDGGAVSVASGTFTMSGGTIGGTSSTKNTATYGGAVSVSSGGSFTMSGGSITGNTATANGGAVSVSGGTFTLSGGTITANTATANGGAVSVTAGLFTLSGGTIGGSSSDKNTATYGGGVYVSSSGEFKLSTGTISYNTATYGGGVSVSGGSFTLSGGTITANTATANGGGVSVSGGSFTLNTPSSQVSITANSADNGGAVSVTGGTFALNGGIIGGSSSNRNTAVNGGGVYVYGGAFNLTSGSISYNTATTNGGGVYMNISNPLTLSNGSIHDNTATNGGGVYKTGSGTFTMNGGTLSITNNTATGSETNGGGVYVANGKFELIAGSIGGNTATNGGGVSVASEGTFTMTGGTIGSTRNTATDKGGGVYARGPFTMSAGTISSNTAKDGGGVYATTSPFTMSNTASISSNTATNDGGGVYASNFTLNAGTISNNTATNNGGGVFKAGYDTFTMNGGTIGGSSSSANNTAAMGAGVYVDAAEFELKAGTISYNTATTRGGGVYVKTFATLTMSGSGGTISNNSVSGIGSGGGVFVDASATFTMSAGAISNNAMTHTSVGPCYGGGVAVTGIFYMSGGTISNNTNSSITGLGNNLFKGPDAIAMYGTADTPSSTWIAGSSGNAGYTNDTLPVPGAL